MKLIRALLFPFAIIYGIITAVRNLFFDLKILKSQSYNKPVIAVGNLSVGGTGKTPMIEYLIRLLREKHRLATLSRGYKRKSKGFILAKEGIKPEVLGDEPFQFFEKFPEIMVAVDEKRVHGISELQSLPNSPEVILLDDAYQHRQVKAGFYILLTSYSDLYTDDFMLPTGNLREWKMGANRAQIIVVTKCPTDLSTQQMENLKQKIKPNKDQNLFFSAIAYDEFIYNNQQKLALKDCHKPKIILAGIAKPQPFFDYLKKEADICLTYPDHHSFSAQEIKEIQDLAKDKIIVTTEKDFMRLKNTILESQTYYLPIRSTFINNQSTFDELILSFVDKGIREESRVKSQG